MLRAMMVVLLGVVLAGNAATEMAEPKCLVAEINPVTGLVLCLNPQARRSRRRPRRPSSRASRKTRAGSGATGLTARPCPKGCEPTSLCLIHYTKT